MHAGVRTLIGGLAGLLIAPVCYVIVASANPDISVLINRDLPGIYSGFYPTEGSFVWTTGDASITLRGLNRNTPHDCEMLIMTYCPDPALFPEVTFAVDGAVVMRVAVTNADQTVHIPIAADSRRQGAVIGIDCSKIFVPGPQDKRELGIVVKSISIRQSGGGLALPSPLTFRALLIAGGSMGAGLGFICASVFAAALITSSTALVGALLLCHGVARYSGYLETFTMVSLSVSVAGLLTALILRGRHGDRLDRAGRIFLAISISVTCVNLMVLLHPYKPEMDDLMHVHRLQYILSGRYFFTAVPEGGFEYPQAIGFYLFAAPFTWIISDQMSLLKVLVVCTLALTGFIVYASVRRQWKDPVVAATAGPAIQLVPVVIDALGRASMANLFSICASVLAVAILASWGGRGWSLARIIAGIVATTIAFSGHFSTLMVFTVTLAVIAALFLWRGEGIGRRAAGEILIVLAVAGAISYGTYYGRFNELYLKQVHRIINVMRGATPGDWKQSESYTPRQLPEQTPYAPGGASIMKRIESLPTYVRTCLGWPVVLLSALGLWRLFAERRRDRLSLATIGWLLASMFFVLLGILTPLNMRPYLVAAPFLGVALALGAIWCWRTGSVGKAITIVLLAWCIWNAAESYRIWLV